MTDIPTNSWQEDSPVGDDQGHIIDDKLRAWLTQVRELLGINHKIESSGQGENWGKHTKISLIPESSPITINNDRGYLYGIDNDSIVEAQWEDENSNELLITEPDNDVFPTSEPGSLVNGMVWVDNSGSHPLIKYRKGGSTYNCTVFTSEGDIPSNALAIGVRINGTTYYAWGDWGTGSTIDKDLRIYNSEYTYNFTNLNLADNTIGHVWYPHILGKGSGDFLLGFPFWNDYETDSDEEDGGSLARVSHSEATTAAGNSTKYDFTDWRLPTKAEIDKIWNALQSAGYSNRWCMYYMGARQQVMGGSGWANFYWTSTMYDATDYYNYSFDYNDYSLLWYQMGPSRTYGMCANIIRDGSIA